MASTTMAIRRAAVALPVAALAAALALPAARSGAAAEPAPRVVKITAHRFAFTPDQVTLRRGETVRLELHSEDVTHGFFQRALGLDADIPAGGTKTLTLTAPATPGRYLVICHHFCGSGHGNMHMTFVVE